ncbi:ABC transporter ATP-binding protein [Pseudalkalibacillus salsuginis]|uniref:ABC transporter ATP-binding protein n=1 Tax=Pseudalkalibacillus salsuginis TaxID=2910972 RepID=UPI001F1A1173|nr:ABC transporter ATP-binding protein [Pseudalkalibacillus salsuginis]MCF6408905.1 ABC transporter ATP-binding protein [Pseudalkalibacillus salsuginis]
MIEVKGLSHQFKIGKKGKETIIPVLEGINLKVDYGEIVTVVGRSGSGKSTLLNLISGYIQPTEGEIFIDDHNVTSFNESKWADFRLHNLGFIFQSFQLILSMTAFENVELALTLKGVHEKERKTQTEKLFKKVGLEKFMDHYPSELSGGQQQRVSIARALILNPPIILADEPTGSLDSDTEDELLDFIKQLNHEMGITFLIITHDEKVAKIGDRIIEIVDGALVEEEYAS